LRQRDHLETAVLVVLLEQAVEREERGQ